MTVFPYLPVTFLTCAVFLNINKWVYSLLHINFYSRTSDEAIRESAHQMDLVKLSVKKQMLSVATIGVIVLYCIYNLTYFLLGCLHTFP